MGAPFSWALVGPGNIAHRFADAVHHLPDAQITRVVGRDLARAQAFASRWSQGAAVQAGTDLDAMLADPAVDGVYIATPHAQHAASIAKCLAAGKPVLCEKPLVPSLAIARPLIEKSRATGVFLMEALWSRFLPAFDQVAQWLQEGAIGQVRAIQSTFCFPSVYEPHSRLYAPELAGGALLDIGIYNISLSRWVLQTALGECPPLAHSDVRGVLAPTGVDQRVSATLNFAGGAVCQWVCAFDAVADNSMQIVGEHGCILLPHHFWEAQEVLLQRPGEPVLRVLKPFDTNGFEYEILEAMRCIRAGHCESARMPHSETLTVLGWMDAMRAQLGVRYPFE
jgi:predicted dehydrogenase